MNFFRKMYNFWGQLKYEVNLNERKGVEDELVKLKTNYLKQIIDYVLEMEWLVQERAKERVRYYIRNRCDLKKTAKHFEIKKNTLSVALNYAENCLAKKIDVKIIDKLENASSKEEIEELNKQFRLDITYVEPPSIFYKEITKSLPKPKLEYGLSLKECKKELQYLKLFSKNVIELYIKDLDNARVAHILALLEQKETSIEKDLLHQLFYTDTRVNVKEVVALLLSSLENEDTN